MFLGEGFPWDVFVPALVIGILRGRAGSKRARLEKLEREKQQEEEENKSD